MFPVCSAASVLLRLDCVVPVELPVVQISYYVVTLSRYQRNNVACVFVVSRCLMCSVGRCNTADILLRYLAVCALVMPSNCAGPGIQNVGMVPDRSTYRKFLSNLV